MSKRWSWLDEVSDAGLFDSVHYERTEGGGPMVGHGVVVVDGIAYSITTETRGELFSLSHAAREEFGDRFMENEDL